MGPSQQCLPGLEPANLAPPFSASGSRGHYNSCPGAWPTPGGLVQCRVGEAALRGGQSCPSAAWGAGACGSSGPSWGFWLPSLHPSPIFGLGREGDGRADEGQLPRPCVPHYVRGCGLRVRLVRRVGAEPTNSNCFCLSTWLGKGSWPS